MSATPDSPKPQTPVQDTTQTIGPLATENPLRIPDMQEYLKKHGTFSRAIKAYLQPYYRQIPIFTQGPTPEADRLRFERIFRPWPKWVFRLGAELWHVDFPTIDRSVFFETFRVLNVFIFRFTIDPKALQSSISKREVCDRVDYRVIPLVFASFLGHAYEHSIAYRKKFDEDLKAGKITPEEHKVATRSFATEGLEKSLRENFGDLSGDDGVSPFDLLRRIEHSRRKTFDKHGRRKETPLIPIYRVMLYNWITIERMSGPKELANFLTPHLKGKSKSATGELARIATACSRLGVKFRGTSRTFDCQR